MHHLSNGGDCLTVPADNSISKRVEIIEAVCNFSDMCTNENFKVCDKRYTYAYYYASYGLKRPSSTAYLSYWVGVSSRSEHPTSS